MSNKKTKTSKTILVNNPTAEQMDRDYIRAWVEKEMKDKIRFAKSGGNIHQMSLEQQDKLGATISEFDVLEKARIVNLHVEETNAATAKIEEGNSWTQTVFALIAAGMALLYVWG